MQHSNWALVPKNSHPSASSPSGQHARRVYEHQNTRNTIRWACRGLKLVLESLNTKDRIQRLNRQLAMKLDLQNTSRLVPTLDYHHRPRLAVCTEPGTIESISWSTLGDPGGAHTDQHRGTLNSVPTWDDDSGSLTPEPVVR